MALPVNKRVPKILFILFVVAGRGGGSHYLCAE